jgi:hypothetical protein
VVVVVSEDLEAEEVVAEERVEVGKDLNVTTSTVLRGAKRV